MYHKIASSIIALSFLVLVQSSDGVFRFLLAAMVIFTSAVLGYNYWYLKINNFFSFWTWVRPALFFIGLLAIYFVVPGSGIKGLFLIASVGLIYLFEVKLLVASEQLLFLETLVTYFGWALGIFAINFYILPKTYLILGAIALSTFFISRCSFEYIPQTEQKRNFYSWFLALCALEISWAMLFLPVHFTALSIILFNIFYVLWIIIYYHMLHNLTAQKVSFHLILASLIVILTLVSTPWRV